jgi:uncharacterized protein (TIGR02246 family)
MSGTSGSRSKKKGDEVTRSFREGEVTDLYVRLLDAWNQRDADAFADLFALQGHAIGYDGSPMDGREEIRSSLTAIFEDHAPARYVGKVRGVEGLSGESALLRAVAGMVPPGARDLNVHTSVQSLVAVRLIEGWQIVLWQNTPASFDGRPDDRAHLDDELRQLLVDPPTRSPNA